jgi:hypothetical protein
MAELTLHPYTSAHRHEWDEFVDSARNSTFLFKRGYMDYHSDRFADHSLMARKGERLVALLPANLDTTDGMRMLRSHGGLTYGGWILPPRHADAADVLVLFQLLREYCMENGIEGVDYKPLPYIYATMPSQEDRYALFRMGAILKEQSISSTIDLSHNPGFNTQQRRNLRRGAKVADVEIREESDVTLFHRLLSECLKERHDTRPVHDCHELQLLRDRFPESIRVFVLYAGGAPQAGVCMYLTRMVAHAQYICSTPRARAEGLLTVLFNHLFALTAGWRYFDFGISTEDHGLYLNEGLYRQKSSLGGSGVAYERYLLPIPQS